MTTSERSCWSCGREIAQDGQDRDCPSCVSRKAEIKRREEREHFASCLGGYRAFDQYTEESFKVGPESLLAMESCKAFDPTKDNLYLWGPTGSGKSHLAVVAARKFVKIGAKLIKPCEVFRRIRGCRDARDEMEIIEHYSRLKVLIIDDLGIGRDTEFAVTTLYEIIDGRYQFKPGGLIVTTNLSLGDLAKKLGDDRIPSRLAQMCKIINIHADDHRLKREEK